MQNQSPMQAALLTVPTLFAQSTVGKEKIFACVRMGDDAKSLEIWCADSADTTFRALFDEPSLTRVRNSVDGSLSWDRFFRGIEEGFNQRKVQVSQDTGAMSLVVECLWGGGSATNGKKCQFRLDKTSDTNGCNSMLNVLHEFYLLRTDDKWKAEKDTKLQKEQQEAEQKVTATEKELKSVNSTLSGAVAEEQSATEKLKSLEAELRELEKSKPEAETSGADDGFVVEQDDELPHCVSRVPLRNSSGGWRLHKDYDAELMRLVKSKFTPRGEDEDPSTFDYEGSHQHCKIIRPYTASEYNQQMSLLSDRAKQLVLEGLKKLDDWDFDLFSIQNFTYGGSLFITSYALFLRYDFMRKFNLDEQCVINFLSQAEAGYHPNPYHNSMHAADVLHILHYILSPGGLIKVAKLSEEDTFASLIAALIHDYDHPGINNNFHVKTQSYLARLYNDRSILENHHSAEVFELMKDPRFDLLSGLSHEQKKDIRETVIEMVLSTDMGLHAKILGTFKRRLNEDKEFLRKDDVRLALSMGIKVADISNCGRPEQIYLKWASKIADEFFMQGDRERNLGIPVSPFMDRRTPSMAKGQIAFMNYIVIPLFESISEYLPDMHFSVDHVEQNKNYWAQNDDSAL